MSTDPEESELIHAIAVRAHELSAKHGVNRSTLDHEMDLVAAHEDIPLRLKDLLAATDAGFSHDIGGITKHLNRDTFEIENCFRPRYAVAG